MSPYSKDKSGGVCGWANKHAKTSHGVSQDEGGGGGPALCSRLTPCFCWHGCLRVPGSTQTEEPGCPTTTHIWVRRCRLGGTVGRLHFPVIERARMHSVGRPRARMHHACRFWMSVGSNHACSNRARACIMHADYSTVARARASCMQILHANSKCQLGRIMHKFLTPTQGVTENPVQFCRELKDI